MLAESGWCCQLTWKQESGIPSGIIMKLSSNWVQFGMPCLRGSLLFGCRPQHWTTCCSESSSLCQAGWMISTCPSPGSSLKEIFLPLMHLSEIWVRTYLLGFWSLKGAKRCFPHHLFHWQCPLQIQLWLPSWMPRVCMCPLRSPSSFGQCRPTPIMLKQALLPVVPALQFNPLWTWP